MFVRHVESEPLMVRVSFVDTTLTYLSRRITLQPLQLPTELIYWTKSKTYVRTNH